MHDLGRFHLVSLNLQPELDVLPGMGARRGFDAEVPLEWLPGLLILQYSSQEDSFMRVGK